MSPKARPGMRSKYGKYWYMMSDAERAKIESDEAVDRYEMLADRVQMLKSRLAELESMVEAVKGDLAEVQRQFEVAQREVDALLGEGDLEQS